jgi:hypothetical protein
MSSELCGHILGLAKNGRDRGICSRRLSHQGLHSNRTCALCGGGAPRRNTYCRKCRQQYAAGYRETKAETVAQLSAENQQIKAIAGPLLVEQTLNRIMREQSAVANESSVLDGNVSQEN